ncbi:MAG TPA: DUF4097 family beta strand repeat-containing protein [Acidobacteriaceae bacterium]|nr:DUF4097 family beta strand repeat-containing protein [Acidobacteriaceae bacterium]
MPNQPYLSQGDRAMRRFVLFVLAFCAIVGLGALAPRQPFCSRFARSMHVVHAVRAAQVPSNWSTGECQENRHNWGQAHVCEMRRTTFALSGGRLSVETENGGIQVTGEDRSDVALEARVQAWGPSDADAKDLLKQVAIETANGEVRDHAPKRSHFSREGYAVEYHLRVPRHLAADLHTVNGGVDLSQIEGAIRFATTNGGVSLSRVEGDVQGHTTNGGLDIALAGDTWHGEGLRAETMNGGVDMRIPSGYSAHLETGTVNGGISVDFPITVQGEIKNHLATDIGHGGPTVHVQTVNGGVSISRGGPDSGSGE